MRDDCARRERLGNQAPLLVITPAPPGRLGTNDLDPLHERSLQWNSIGDSAAASPVSKAAPGGRLPISRVDAKTAYGARDEDDQTHCRRPVAISVVWPERCRF